MVRVMKLAHALPKLAHFVERYATVAGQSMYSYKLRQTLQEVFTVHLVQVLQEGSIKPLADHMTGQQFTWLQGHLAGMSSPEARRGNAPALTCFLTGASEQGFKYSADYYGCLIAFKPVTPLHQPNSNILTCCGFPHFSQMWERCM